MTDDGRLLAALAVIRARGAIGERSLVDAVAHADRFVDLIPAGDQSVVDIGSGGGLPALVIAWHRGDVSVTMVERRATRADLLRRAVRSLQLADRTTVTNVDAVQLCIETPARFDVVTARSFADIATTTGFVAKLLRPGGVGLVSETPTDRSSSWAIVFKDHPELEDHGVEHGIRRLIRGSSPSCCR
jgi:16S rRNA G527 N7-methylase RsmG